MSEPTFKKGLFDRWYIFHPWNITQAWSGSRWVPCMTNGFPIGDIQVCNFETEKEAREYWMRSSGPEPQKEIG